MRPDAIPEDACRSEVLCPCCGVGCRLVVHVRGSDVLDVRGSPEASANRGRICPRGAALGHVQLTDNRATTPLLREDRSLPFRPVSWEESTRFVAQRLAEVVNRHGPHAFGFYGSGQLDTESAYTAVKFVKGAIGTNNTGWNRGPAIDLDAADYRECFGCEAPPTCYEDISAAEVILILGSNIAESHPVVFDFLRAKKRIHPHTFILVVAPQKTRTSAAADAHVAIAPGSEGAFLTGISHFLVARGLVDHRFIREHTTGFEDLSRHLERQDIHELAAACRIEPGVLLSVADRIGCASRVLSICAPVAVRDPSGAHRSAHVLNLHLLTGQVGKPGTGPFLLGDQPNRMGCREAGLPSDLLPGLRDVENAQDRQELEAAWGLPAGRISPRAGLGFLDMLHSLAASTTHAIWIAHPNFTANALELKAAQQGLANAELVVVQECGLSSSAIDFAHVVFPASGWIEKECTSTTAERNVTFSEPAVPAPGDARPDWQILCQVAREMGQAGFDFADSASIWDEFRHLTQGRSCDMYGISAGRLRQERSVQWPCPDGAHPGSPRLYSDRRFFTPDGRARFLPFREAATPEARVRPITVPGQIPHKWITPVTSTV